MRLLLVGNLIRLVLLLVASFYEFSLKCMICIIRMILKLYGCLIDMRMIIHAFQIFFKLSNISGISSGLYLTLWVIVNSYTVWYIMNVHRYSSHIYFPEFTDVIIIVKVVKSLPDKATFGTIGNFRNHSMGLPSYLITKLGLPWFPQIYYSTTIIS